MGGKSRWQHACSWVVGARWRPASAGTWATTDMPATAKTKPISALLLRKVRDRKTQACPYCGAGNFRLLASRFPDGQQWLYSFTCSKCRKGFFLPVSRKFDPAVPEPTRLAQDGWCKCAFCHVRFKFRNRYEQCPCCGKVLIGDATGQEFKLKDNEAQALEDIAQ